MHVNNSHAVGFSYVLHYYFFLQQTVYQSHKSTTASHNEVVARSAIRPTWYSILVNTPIFPFIFLNT